MKCSKIFRWTLNRKIEGDVAAHADIEAAPRFTKYEVVRDCGIPDQTGVMNSSPPAAGAKSLLENAFLQPS